MAPHIHSIVELKALAVDKPMFWASLREGQLMFPIGRAEISQLIDAATQSILSHVTTVVKYRGQWCVFEATWPQVGLTPIWHYIDSDEDLILCKRVDPATGKEIDMTPALDASVNYLRRNYAVLGLVKAGLHLAFSQLPPEMNDRECYCSGVTELINQATSLPYPKQKGQAPTPAFLFEHPSTVVVCTRILERAEAAASA